MYKVDSVFLCQLHAHTLPLRMYWPRLFSKILTMTMFITSQSFISLLSFIFVSAAVSELEPEQEEEEKFYFQFIILLISFLHQIVGCPYLVLSITIAVCGHFHNTGLISPIYSRFSQILS